MAETGYEDIDRWSSDQKTLLQQQQEKQADLINQQTQLTVDELNRNRDKVDVDATKTNRGLYTDYQKQANQYGVEAERQAQMGLANSGYSETSKVNLYNNYQKNVTETLNNARQLKADFDFQVAQARKQGNITQAQSALELLKQQMQLLTQEYEMRNNRKQYLEQFNYTKQRDAVNDSHWQTQFDYTKQRDNVADRQWQTQFDYTKQRDAVSDNQWQTQFDYQKSRDAVSDNQWQSQFDYQKSRDAVSDSQWERQYELSKKAQATRASRSSGSSSKKTYKVSEDDNTVKVSEGQNSTANSSAKQTANKVNISEYSLDKKVEATLATTKANSKARDNFLSGLVKSGKITSKEKAYLMGV